MGCVPKGSKHPSLKRDFVAEFEALSTDLKGQCVLAVSSVDVAESKLDALRYAPDRRATRRAKWRRFRTALSDCLGGEIVARSTNDGQSLEIKDVAHLFAQETRNLEDVNLVNMVAKILNGFEECTPLQADDIAGFGGRVSDEGRTWAQDRMVILNEMITLVDGYAIPKSQSLLDEGLTEFQRKADVLLKAVSDGRVAVKKDYSATEQEKKKLREHETTLRSRHQELTSTMDQCRSLLTAIPDRRTQMREALNGIVKKIGRR